jgi:hypothetical protein
MWWVSRKGSWPPHGAEEAQHGAGGAQQPQAGRLHAAQPATLAPGYYVEGHANWHDAAMPDHARRSRRLR